SSDVCSSDLTHSLHTHTHTHTLLSLHTHTTLSPHTDTHTCSLHGERAGSQYMKSHHGSLSTHTPFSLHTHTHTHARTHTDPNRAFFKRAQMKRSLQRRRRRQNHSSDKLSPHHVHKHTDTLAHERCIHTHTHTRT